MRLTRSIRKDGNGYGMGGYLNQTRAMKPVIRSGVKKVTWNVSILKGVRTVGCEPGRGRLFTQGHQCGIYCWRYFYKTLLARCPLVFEIKTKYDIDTYPHLINLWVNPGIFFHRSDWFSGVRHVYVIKSVGLVLMIPWQVPPVYPGCGSHHLKTGITVISYLQAE